MEDQSHLPNDFEQWTKRVPIVMSCETNRNSGTVHTFVTTLNENYKPWKLDFGKTDVGMPYDKDPTQHFPTNAVLRKDYMGFSFGGKEENKDTVDLQLNPNADKLEIVYLFIKRLDEKQQSQEEIE